MRADPTTRATGSTLSEEFPGALHLWLYRAEKDGSIVAIDPNGEHDGRHLLGFPCH